MSPAPFEAATISELDPITFELLRGWIHRECGIYLNDAKRALLTSRLSRRLRAVGVGSFAAYYRYVTQGDDPAERRRLIEEICTHETQFFREPAHFARLGNTIFPAIRAAAERGDRPKRVRAWSAGCSTGEEPYSLAMSLLAAFGADWTLEVLATDVSERALETGRRAIYPVARAESIPAHLLKAFMLRGVGAQDGFVKVSPEARALVRFEPLNLVTPPYPAGAPFDVVLCRNVLIYFDAEGRERTLRQLVHHLVPGGHLFLGHAETVMRKEGGLRSVAPTIYVREPPS